MQYETRTDPERLETALAEARAAKAALEQEIRSAKLLQSLSTQLIEADTGDPHALYERLLDAAVAIMRSDYASIQALDARRGELELLGFRGFNPAAAEFWKWVRPDSKSTCGMALARRERVVVEDLRACEAMAGSEDLKVYLDTGILAVQTTPLLSRAGTLIGMISTHWRLPHLPSDADLRSLDVISRLAADLMENHQAATRAAAYTRQFETLVNAAPVGLFLVDADFRVTHVNPVALPVFEDIPGGALGKDFGEIVRTLWEEHSADELVRILRGTLETGEPYVALEREEHRLGRRHREYYEWRVERITFADGRSGVVCYFRDISEQVLVRKTIEESRAALQESDVRKDRFLAVLAHELRNPLAPLRNGLEVMKIAGAGGAVAEQARAVMERQLGQLVRIVDDLLDISRISRDRLELHRAHVPLGDVVASALETCGTIVRDAGVQLDVDIPRHPIYVDADATRLSQVLCNLLVNAARYTERGGHAWLTVRRDEDTAVVSVRDTGVGIPADVLPVVFDMFAQTDPSMERSQGGLGIGLTLVKRLVEMHDGTVEARSEGRGRGSEFIVRLPLILEPVRHEARPWGESPAPPVPARVLVVDDNPDAAESLATMLTLMGHATRIAQDGLQALDATAAFRPDLILMDIGMPNLNGYDACRRLRDVWGPDILIVALTGWGQEGDKRRAWEAGFDAHLVKPVEPAALRTLLSIPLPGTPPPTRRRSWETQP